MVGSAWSPEGTTIEDIHMCQTLLQVLPWFLPFSLHTSPFYKWGNGAWERWGHFFSSKAGVWTQVCLVGKSIFLSPHHGFYSEESQPSEACPFGRRNVLNGIHFYKYCLTISTAGSWPEQNLAVGFGVSLLNAGHWEPLVEEASGCYGSPLGLISELHGCQDNVAQKPNALYFLASLTPSPG